MMMRWALPLVAIPLLAADLRLGIVGTDTSHVIEFTRSLNSGGVPGARIVAAFKGGSPDFERSRSRVEGYARELAEKYGVEFVDQIGGLCSKVDAILLESVDGRQHLPQMREVVRCGKPVFIDKPLAASLADAREIAKIAKAAGVSWFSASSLRWSEITDGLKFPDTRGVQTWGPGPYVEGLPLDLSWYGIHAIEALYTLMGPGCEEVTRVYGAVSDEIVGRWRDGRIGSVRTLRPEGEYGAIVFREGKGIAQSPAKPKIGYDAMLREIITFLQTGNPPVSNEETLEIMSFMDAAQRSKDAGGKPVRLQ